MHLKQSSNLHSKAAFTRIQISGSQRSGYLRGVYTYWIETFSAFTRVQISGCIIRGILAMCRRNTQMPFFSRQVECFQILFHFSFFFFIFFMFVGWTTRSKFCLVSSVIDYKTQRLIDGVDLLEIGPVNACEMAFKLNEASCMWKTFKIRLCWYRTRKERRKVFEACGKKKKPAFIVSSRRKPQSACTVTSGCPVYTCPKSTGTSG